MSDKRIIEEPASEEIFHDDWLVKDSPLNETTKIQASVFMALVVDAAKEGMVPYAMLATEWTALTTYYKDQVVIYNGELYRAKDTNVSPTFNPSAWTKISFDTLYRTTLADVKNSICEEWSTSGEYTLNDCAIHEDKLYKCVADTATVGTWVSSEWELVSIYEIIQNLPKSASDVTYDNTDSGLEADNVQDALDEVAETITELSNTTEVTGTASGAIATFTDGADAPLKSLKVAVTPYQDLHGYDAPWAGGAGKNKFNPIDLVANKSLYGTDAVGTSPILHDSNASKVYKNIAYLNANTTYVLSFRINGSMISTNVRKGYICDNNGLVLENNITIQNSTDNYVTITPTTSGWLWGAFDNSTTDLQIEQGTSPTSFAPYSNICPIIGWDEANVTRCGKNLFNKSDTQTGVLKADGSVGAGVTKYVSGYIKISPNTSYYLTDVIPANDGRSGFWYDANKNPIEVVIKNPPSLTSFAVTSPSNAEYIRIGCYISSVETCQLELGDTPTTYSPYNGATYTIDLDGTRYGSELDVLNGVDIDTLGSVDLGTLNWTYTTGDSYAGSPYFASGNIANKKAGSSNMICSQYGVGVNRGSIQDGVIAPWNNTNALSLACRDDRFTDAATFKSAMSGVQLVYELATPITVQLSPTAVKSLEGENNIFADCGDINNVEYIRNLNITINDLLSRING